MSKNSNLNRRHRPIERYTPRKKAELLLDTATTHKEYARARKEAKKLGLDRDAISHRGSA